MGFMKFQSKNQMKLNFVQVGGKKRFIHFLSHCSSKVLKQVIWIQGMGEKHNKKMAKKKQIKKIDDHFFSLKKQGKNWVEIKNLDWGKALYKKHYCFFRIFFFLFFGFIWHIITTFCVLLLFYLAWVFLRFVKDLSYKKEKNSWIKKYITAWYDYYIIFECWKIR